MFQNYLRIAFRNVYKHKVHSFINVFGLAIGLASFVIIFLYVQDEFRMTDITRKPIARTV